MDFRTRFNRPPKSISEEKTSKNRLVEIAGYIPARERIEALINAGQRLADYRKAQYDVPEGEEVPDEIVPDPTRNPNFDLADASMIASDVSKSMEQVKIANSIEQRKRREALEEQQRKDIQELQEARRSKNSDKLV